MNNKGFAITTMVYAAIILFSLIMFSILGIEKNRYINQKSYVEEINTNLGNCLREGEC